MRCHNALAQAIEKFEKVTYNMNILRCRQGKLMEISPDANSNDDSEDAQLISAAHLELEILRARIGELNPITSDDDVESLRTVSREYARLKADEISRWQCQLYGLDNVRLAYADEIAKREMLLTQAARLMRLSTDVIQYCTSAKPQTSVSPQKRAEKRATPPNDYFYF
jgi:hypothetical protein